MWRLYQPVIGAGVEIRLTESGAIDIRASGFRDLCEQIDELARHVPEEEDRAYAALAKEQLWKMYQSAHKRALARTGLGR